MRFMLWSIRLLLSMAIIVHCLGLDAFYGRGAVADTEVVVFAAASTTNAVNDIGKLFADRNLGRMTPSFASSSTLAKQIENGAPADVYISASKKWMDYLEKKVLLAQGSRFDMLSNRIVLIAPAKSTIKAVTISPGFSIAEALGDEGRLAMGDPEHVPAGTYGKLAFQKLGCWDAVKVRIAPMKDVRAALVLVERGEAPLGQVYATDAAISHKVKVVGIFPADSYPPIVYPVAAVAGGRMPVAKAFIEFLKTAEAMAVFSKYGFEPAGPLAR